MYKQLAWKKPTKTNNKTKTTPKQNNSNNKNKNMNTYIHTYIRHFSQSLQMKQKVGCTNKLQTKYEF